MTDRPKGGWETVPGVLRSAWIILPVLAWALALYLLSEMFTYPSFFFHHSPHYFLLVGAVVVLAFLLAEPYLGRGVRFLRPFRVPLFLLVTGIGLAVLASEAFLRIADPLGLSYFGEYARYVLARIPDKDLKYRHRPNFSGKFLGVELAFNEQGLREDPIGPKEPGEYRILLLGDSQTMGWGVERQYTWPVRLQRLLTERLHRRVRTINTGVISYETRQEYRYLMRDGWDLEPDMVLLMYMDNDIQITDEPYDPWGEAALKGKPPSQVLSLLEGRTRLHQLIYRWNLVGIHREGWNPEQVALPSAFEQQMQQDPGWRYSMEYLRKIASECRDRGVPFAVAHFDWYRFPFSEALHRSVVEAVAPAPVAYVADWFEGMDVRSLIVSVTDSHPNAEAHRIEADGLAEFLLDLGWIPPGDTGGETAP